MTSNLLSACRSAACHFPSFNAVAKDDPPPGAPGSATALLAGRIDGMRLKPVNRAYAHEALAWLPDEPLHGLIRADALCALITLHRLKVIDLNDVGRRANPPMNAIEYFCEFLPPASLAPNLDVGQVINKLLGAGLSANGARGGKEPPLVRALHHPRSASLVPALLAGGGDPLRKDPLGRTCLALAAELGKTAELDGMLRHLLATAENTERMFVELTAHAVREDSVLMFERLCALSGEGYLSALARGLVANGKHLGFGLQRYLLGEQTNNPLSWETRCEALKQLARCNRQDVLVKLRALMRSRRVQGSLAEARAQDLFDGLLRVAAEKGAANSLKGLLPGARPNGLPDVFRITQPHELLVTLSDRFSGDAKGMGKIICSYLDHTPARSRQGDVLSKQQVFGLFMSATAGRRWNLLHTAGAGLATAFVAGGLVAMWLARRSSYLSQNGHQIFGQHYPAPIQYVLANACESAFFEPPEDALLLSKACRGAISVAASEMPNSWDLQRWRYYRRQCEQDGQAGGSLNPIGSSECQPLFDMTESLASIDERRQIAEALALTARQALSYGALFSAAIVGELRRRRVVDFACHIEAHLAPQ